MNPLFFQRCGVLLLSILCAAPAWADGTITHFSGEIAVQKKDGTTLPGTAGMKVSEGDVMITGANGYGRLEMTDGGEMVLRPNSQLKVESYRFNPNKPADDSFVFSMLKGGLRTVTGLIGKRGNKDAYELKTQTATIGIRGTQFDLRVCQGSCGSLADGTYLAVRFGAVQTSNAQGSLAVAAGQVAYVPSQRPPVMLPRDPGIGFTPPAVIPKMDEKKKQQSAAAAAAAPAQAKPAASGSGQSTTSNTQRSGQAASGSSSSSTASTSGGSSSGSNTGAQESGGSDSGGKSGSSSGSPASSGTTTTSASTSSNASSTASSSTASSASGNAATQSSSAAPTADTSPAQQAPAQQAQVQQAPAQTAPAAPAADTAAPAQQAPVQQAPAQTVVAAAPAALSTMPPILTPIPQAAPGLDCSVQ